jgi:hypothetical protein
MLPNGFIPSVLSANIIFIFLGSFPKGSSSFEVLNLSMFLHYSKLVGCLNIASLMRSSAFQQICFVVSGFVNKCSSMEYGWVPTNFNGNVFPRCLFFFPDSVSMSSSLLGEEPTCEFFKELFGFYLFCKICRNLHVNAGFGVDVSSISCSTTKIAIFEIFILHKIQEEEIR